MQTESMNGHGGSGVGSEERGGRVRLYAGGAEDVLEAASRRLEAGERLVIVARTLPAAVRLREALAPTRIFDEAGLPITQRIDGRAALYRAGEAAPRRRGLLEEHDAGRLPALILTPDDLEAHGTLEAFAARERAVWLVDDAHYLSMSTSGFVPAMRRLVAVHAHGVAQAMHLFASSAGAAAIEELRVLFGLEDDAIEARPVVFPETVGLALRFEPAALTEREVLRTSLRSLQSPGSIMRGVLVAALEADARSDMLPPAELESVIEEVGAEPVIDPGESAEAEPERWAALYRRADVLLLTENPEAIDIIAPGGPGVVLRLVPPESPETILDECIRLARRGGGQWALIGDGVARTAEKLPMEQLERLGHWLAGQVGTGERPVPLDAQEVVKALELPGEQGLRAAALALEDGLGELVGAGFLSRARRARFQLEVAESHRFRTPHIDKDRRYVELAGRYEDALAKMGMLQSVKYRLNALPPKDLRVLSGFLGYSIGELNVLFDDLAREGIIVCRQVVAGSPGNLNFEVVGASSGEQMLSALPTALERIRGRRAQAEADRDAVRRLIEGGADPVPALMEAIEAQLNVQNTGMGGLPVAVAPPPLHPEPARTASTEPAARPTPSLGETVHDTRAATTASDRAAASDTRTGARPGDADASLEKRLEEQREPRADALTSLLALAAELQRSARPGSSLQRLHEAARTGNIGAATLQILLLSQAGEGEAAARATQDWIGIAPAGLRQAWLTTLLNAVDYRIDLSSAGRGGLMPDGVRRLALLTPALENLNPGEIPPLVEASGIQGAVEPAGFGTVRIADGDERFVLQRQATPPEAEAQLWLVVDEAGDTGIAPELIRGRLVEAYLTVAGLEDEALTSRLAERVAAEAELPALAGAARQTVALCRIWSREGREQQVIDALAEIPAGSSAYPEAVQLRAEVLLKSERPLEALDALSRSGLPPGRGEAQAVWQATTHALTRISEAHATCETCPLLETAFCPAGEAFWALVEQNPFGEQRRNVRYRAEKRARHGLDVDGPQRLLMVLERLGGRWDEAVFARWIENASLGRAEDWVGLAQRLLEESPRLALKAADRISSVNLEPRLRIAMVKLRLAASDLAGALELARRLEAEGGRNWDVVAFNRELEQRLGRQWENRIDGLSEGLPTESVELLRRIGEGVKARGALQAQRQRVEMHLRKSAWRELREALSTYRDLVGEGGERDGVVRDAEARLADRERRVRQRIEQLSGEGGAASAVKGELARLAEEAEQLGLSELAERGRQLVAASIAAAEASAAEAQRARAAAEQERRASGRRDDGRIERDGAGRQGRGGPGQQGGEGQQGRDQAPRSARTGEHRAPREGRPGDSGRGERPGGQRPHGAPGRREATAPRGPGMQAQGAGGGPRRPMSLDEPALLQAMKEARGDRERVRMVMPALSDLLGNDPDRGTKLLKEALPLFEHQGALDGALAREVREGRPDDGALAGLRRTLEKDYATKFAATLSELNSREHPEPWKQVLGQLKLKS